MVAENLTTDTKQDKELVLQAKKGDFQAMNALLLKYQSFVFNLVYKHLNHYEESRECTQEVFLSVFKGIRSSQMKSSFKTWLYRVTVNRAIHDYHKKKKRNQSTFYLRDVFNPKKNDASEDREYEIPDTDSIPYKTLEKKEREKQLHRAIASVKEIYKIPLVLRDIEGLPYEEIAGILKIDLGTVKSRISRGRESLRTILMRNKES